MGLMTKLNLLTVGLIALTAVTITSFYFWQQWRDDQLQLRAQGRTVLAMLADLSAPALAVQDKTSIEQILGGIAAKLGDAPLPPFQIAAKADTTATNGEHGIGGLRIVELMTPVVASAGGP